MLALPPIEGREMQLVTSYEELLAALRERRKALHLTLAEVNHRAGLQDGYSEKVECRVRGLGRVSLPALLGTYGLALAVVTVAEPEPGSRACMRDGDGLRPRKKPKETKHGC